MTNAVLWEVCAIIIGACIGSYLNVVIYRTPRGLSVNSPKRSFCPGCNTPIPWWRNIPIVTWILQGGKCNACGAKIAFHYIIVEIITALLFWLAWKCVPMSLEAILAWLFISLLISISFIDGEHYVIPVNWCWVASGIALITGSFFPKLLHLGSEVLTKQPITSLPPPPFPATFHIADGIRSLSGFLFGYLGLALIVLLGKFFFGKKKATFDPPEKWYLKEPQNEHEQLEFVIGENQLPWGELFYRKHDKIEISTNKIMVDGKKIPGKRLIIKEEEIVVGERTFYISDLQSLSGEADEVSLPREAMGGGDPPLLGMIGAFLGPSAVLFTVFSSSVYALFTALLGRIGFGTPLPFGPFLALGALTWMLGGHQLFHWYLNILGV